MMLLLKTHVGKFTMSLTDRIVIFLRIVGIMEHKIILNKS